MKKDIPIKKVTDIAVAALPSEEDPDFWEVFLLNLKNDEIKNVLISSRGYGEIDGKKVAAINYSAYEEMAEKTFHEIREAAFEKFDLTCMHIYHSMGIVKAGEICLFVFTSSAHRKETMDA